MKYVKALGLFALAAAALMAFAGSASATQVTSPKGTVYTSTIKAEGEGETTLENKSIGLKVQCEVSVVEGKVESHGTSVTTAGKISKLTYEKCTNGYIVTVLKTGTLEVHTEVSVNNGNGTLTSSGAEVTIHTPLGFSCTYTTNNTDIGILKGSVNTNKTATLEIGSSNIPRTEDSALCGTSAVWTGSYSVVTPDYLDVD
ncbi:MAG: hypothetical protein ACTHN3_07505 [Solirubrobacterales bacterium]